MTAEEIVAPRAAATALTPAVRAELELRKQSASPRLAQRALVVLLAAEGISDRRIAMLTRMHHNRVAVWRHRFAAQGLPGLEDEPRPGRPPRRDVGELLAVAGVPGDEVAPASAWRARRVLELAPDRSDLVSRLVGEHRAGHGLAVTGVLLQPRCSAIAVVCEDGGRRGAGEVVVPAGPAGPAPTALPRRVGTHVRQQAILACEAASERGTMSMLGFVTAVVREWRGSGRVHVLIEHGGALAPRRKRREGGSSGPAQLWPTRSRAAWTAQAEVVVELARVAAQELAGEAARGGVARCGAARQAGGGGLVAVEELRDHSRRAGGEWRLLRRSDGGGASWRAVEGP